jgi:hypothetical protein
MSDAVRCAWCDQPFRMRHSGGHAQRFCRPACRRKFHAAVRRWGLDAVGTGALTIADIRNGPATTRALIRGGISLGTAPEAETEVDALGALLRDILDALSIDELAELPEPVWALLEFIAGPH